MMNMRTNSAQEIFFSFICWQISSTLSFGLCPGVYWAVGTWSGVLGALEDEFDDASDETLSQRRFLRCMSENLITYQVNNEESDDSIVFFVSCSVVKKN